MRGTPNKIGEDRLLSPLRHSKKEFCQLEFQKSREEQTISEKINELMMYQKNTRSTIKSKLERYKKVK